MYICTYCTWHVPVPMILYRYGLGHTPNPAIARSLHSWWWGGEDEMNACREYDGASHTLLLVL